MNLFQLGDFTLHSGQKSSWRIECDALTPEDWAALAAMAAERLPQFSVVIGVPRGGTPFEEALRAHATDDQQLPVLLVDDVWTTGGSMRAERKKWPTKWRVIGCVVFARGPVDDWVTPLFQMR
jgi:orotate phosphoribosyltransferase